MTNNNRHRVTSSQIIERYLSFFLAREHMEMPGGSLVETGGSTSFIIAGMQPLLPYLRGQEIPPSKRLTSLQRCLRTDDVEAVGTNGHKLTCFHMLGNWSVGDYGKREVIEMAMELLHDFGIDQQTLWITTFAGDPDLHLTTDELAVEEWLRVGMSPERIVPLGTDDNFWTMGGTGPCGPCSEIFVDRGIELGCGKPTCQPSCTCERFLEIWNLVFIEFERFADGSLASLPFLSIDTGMGLERLALVLQGSETVFETDLFMPAATRLLKLAPMGVAGGGLVEVRARRIILDHTRSALFAGLAGVLPGRDGRNSVVRRLIRRASRQGRILGINGPCLSELMQPLLKIHDSMLTEEEREHIPHITDMFVNEESQFARVLTVGLRQLEELKPDTHGLIAGESLFKLHTEKGFPSDMAVEILAERGLMVDWPGYERALHEHKEISRLSAERHFS